MNIPNILTVLRVALIPIFVLVYMLPFHCHHFVAAFIFTVAAFTDWLDGRLARLWNQTTPFGAFLDPVADKLIVTVALVALVARHNNLLVTLCAMVIIGREIAVSALREWSAKTGVSSKTAVSIFGKLKTTAQMFAIVILLISDANLDSWQTVLGYVLLTIASLLTIWSMFDYLRASWSYLKYK